METLQVISLGGGVQSSTMLLMSCLGEISKADVAIFADTQGEPQEVYDYIDYLKGIAEGYGVPVFTVTKGDLIADFMAFVEGRATRASMIPLMTKDPDTGQAMGLLGRHCTHDYKIMPIRRKVREILKDRGLKEADMWIGISTDEITRMKESRVQFIRHKFPLIDKKLSRMDCLHWYNSHDFKTPPRSACYFCPFHSQSEWRRVKGNNPELFEKAVQIDKRVRRFGKTRGENYLHKDRIPLADAVDRDDLQNDLDLFGAECEGMCGV